MSNTVNIVLTAVGAAGVLSALSSVQGGLAGISTEAVSAGASAAGLGAFATEAGAAAAAIAGLRNALELGTQLTQLSARTGQSIQDLVVLRRAFENTGLGADNIGMVLNRLQRALSGVNEMGVRTDDAFKRLGLSTAALKNLSGLDQLQALTRGFAQIKDPTERAAVAMQIFGREGGQMLQLLGNSHALSDAAEDAADLAARMQRDSEAFHEAGVQLSAIKGKLMDMFAAATEQLLPALEKVGSVIKGLSLGQVGAVGGAMLPTLMGAFGGAALVSKVVTGLDTAVMKWSMSPKTGAAAADFAERFILPLTGGLSGLLAKLLPIGLAGAVVAAIIQGVEAAMIEANREEEAATARRYDAITKVRKAIEEARSREAQEAAVKDAKETIARLDALAKTKVTNPIYQSGPNTFAGGDERTRGLTPEEQQQREDAQREVDMANSAGAKKAIIANQQADADAKRLEDAKAIAAELDKQAASYQAAVDKAKYSQAEDAQKLTLLDAQTKQANDQYAADVAAADLAKDTDAQKAAAVKRDAELLAIGQSRKEVEKSIAEAAKKEAEAAASAAEKAKQAELAKQRMAVDAAKNALDDKQVEIQGRLAKLDADYAHTDTEKWAERKQALTDAVAAAQEYYDTMQDEAAAAKTDEGKKIADTNVRGAKNDLGRAQNALGALGPDPHSFGDNWTKALRDLRAEWQITGATIAESIGSVLNTLSGSLSSSIEGLIMRTKTWAQAFRDVASAVINSVINAIVEMGVHWVLSSIMMAVAGKSILAASVAAQIPMASAASAIWAAPATLATIASWGGAAASAPFEVMGAIGMTQAMSAMPGFSAGGYTGEDGGIVHAHEFVFSPPAVTALGVSRLDAIHQAALNGSPSPAAGGRSASGGGAQQPPPVYILMDEREFARKMQEHSEAWFQQQHATAMRKG